MLIIKAVQSSQPPHRRDHKYSGDPVMILRDQVLGKDTKSLGESTIVSKTGDFPREAAEREIERGRCLPEERQKQFREVPLKEMIFFSVKGRRFGKVTPPVDCWQGHSD